MPQQEPKTTNDRWQTSAMQFIGGMITNTDELDQAKNSPGSLATAINYEAGLKGGYRRISGYVPFEATAVPGTGAVLGVGVAPFGIIAARNENLYFSPGSGGWTLINTSGTRTTPPKVRFSRFNFGSEKVIITDGVNPPATFDGTTYAVLGTAPVGASYAFAYANYMFFANDNILTFSAPEDETDYDPADGAGVINAGFTIVGLHSWRGSLYIWGTERINSLTGTVFGGSTPDAVYAPVTTNIGCIAPDTIQEISSDILYLSSDGIRTILGTTRIGDLELGAITNPIHTDFLDFFTQYQSNNLSACIVRSKNQYRLFAANTGTVSAASQGWNVCIRNTSISYTGVINNWEFFQLQGINASCADSGYVGSVEYVVHGSFDGWVYRQEEGATFNGVAISALLRIPYNGYDDPELRKTFYKLKTNLVSEGPATINCQLSFDYGTSGSNQPVSFPLTAISSGFAIYGSSTYGSAMYGGTPNRDVVNTPVGSGMNMALIYFSDQTTDNPYTIRSVVLDYQLNGRR